MKKLNLTALILSVIVSNLWSQQLAFPGAEGYGKYTTGGRGGKVYEVTNLNSSGPGSLGAAIDASGARTVVFRVSGTIPGNFRINNGNITIAGQTAPGDGICIKGNLSISADNVIIRYIRIRFDPSTGESDAIFGRYRKNIIIDHVSASWSTDEVLSVYMNENVTVQWCMITEACAKFVDGENTGHQFGGIWGNNYGTSHHNLFAHNASRTPRWASGCGYNDYRNNVLYNWGYQSCYGGEKSQTDSDFGFTTINMIANYYKPGPATQSGVKSRIAEPSTRDGEADAGKWWLSDNYVVGSSIVTTDNWKGFARTEPYFRLDRAWQAMPIAQQTAEDAYLAVLEGTGCSFPKRDSVDARIIEEVRTGTATYGNNGILDRATDTEGWPDLNSTAPPADTDHDGMPDDWETDHGLNKDDPADRNGTGEGGYTNLEVYLYSLLGDGGPVTGVSLSPDTATLNIGSSAYLTATVTPVNPFNKNVSWSSGDTTIATVDPTGLLTGVAEGTATITVTTEDGGFTATSDIDRKSTRLNSSHT